MNVPRATAAVLLGLGFCNTAYAQQPAVEAPATARQEAQAALAEAHKLGKRGDFESACVLFEKSARAEPSADALLNAGICREYHADLAGALDAFEKALDSAQGRSRQQAAIQPRIDALRPRVPTIELTPPPTADTAVAIDGQPVPHFGSPWRLNPGEHRLQATAPRARPHSRTFSLAEGQALALEIPALPPEPASSPTPPVPPKPVQGKRSQGDPSTSAVHDSESAWRKPLVFGGVAVFAAGGAFSAWQFISMANARSRKHDLADRHGCNIDGESAPSAACDASVQNEISDIYHDEEEPARKRAWIGLAASGVGAAAALIGVFALPETNGRSGELRVRPRVAIAPGLFAAELTANF